MMISIDRHTLSTLLDCAATHIEDIETGIRDGYYEEADNTDLVGKKNALQAAKALMPEESIAPGVRVQTVNGEVDTDEDGALRQTEPGTWGVIASHNHADHWDLTFPGGGWVVVTEAELADDTQYRVAKPSQSDSSQDHDNSHSYVHHAATGRTGIFTAKYDQHAARDGHCFTVLGVVDPSSFDAQECGVLFAIQFADGELIQAWPEEVQSVRSSKSATAQRLRTDAEKSDLN